MPFKPSFKPLNLAQLPSFEDELSIEELRYTINRLDEANRSQRLPNPDHIEEAAHHQTPTDQEQDITAEVSGSQTERGRPPSSALNESHPSEVELGPSPAVVAFGGEASGEISAFIPKRHNKRSPRLKQAAKIEQGIVAREETTGICITEEPELVLIQNDWKPREAIFTAAQAHREEVIISDIHGKDPPAAREQSATEVTEEDDMENDGLSARRSQRGRRREVKEFAARWRPITGSAVESLLLRRRDR